MIYVTGRGASQFKPNEQDLKIVRQRNLHFIPFASPPPPGSPYAAGKISDKDYSGLIAPGAVVPVWTVPAVLAVYDWKPGKKTHQDRYRRVKNFIDIFFASRGRLNDGPGGFDDNWCGIDLSQTVGGWNRLSYVDEWLAAHPGEDMRICPPAVSCSEAFASDMRGLGLDPSKPEVANQFNDWKAKKGQACQ